MCRWMAWLGQEVLVEELLFKTQHGIVDQSLHARMGAEPTNGDGFGMGWYGAGEGPGVYHSVAPEWGDENLRELAAHIESPLFLAHVRAAIGSPIQATNCHPFRRGRWLFVHNGFIAEFHTLRQVYRPDELWARSYAQYVVSRSGRSDLAAGIADLRMATHDEYALPLQWGDEEFDAIAAEIELLFRRLGWRSK